MPELPEVETVVRGLRATVVGRTIRSVDSANAHKSTITVAKGLTPHSFDKLLAGRTVQAVTRRGKNILIQLSDDLTLWGHLKMTGHFFWIHREAPTSRHDLVIFEFEPLSSDDAMHLRFNDFRRFGRLRLFPNDLLWKQPGLSKLGPEPLEMEADQFVEIAHRRPRQIKMALMDQTFLAGVGNIYADESLYLSRIHPRRLTTSLSAIKLRELHGHIQYLLKKAIRLRGTSVDSYSGVNGKTGTFQNYLKAYGNEGEPCERCGKAIVRIQIGQRSAHFCPKCQRLR
jgi:formamidopyrimidine-DNA glycosylase